MPETNNDIDIRYPVVSKSNCNSELIMSGGVMIATKIANRCCTAAKMVSRKGGRSFSPINKFFFLFHRFLLLSNLYFTVV